MDAADDALTDEGPVDVRRREPQRAGAPAGEAGEAGETGEGTEKSRGGALDRVERVVAPVPVLLNGNALAGSFAFSAFVALFPLMLVAIAVVGFAAAHGTTDPADRIINALGMSGNADRTVHDAVAAAEHNRKATSIIGLLGLFWSSLGLVAALQYVFNRSGRSKRAA